MIDRGIVEWLAEYIHDWSKQDANNTGGGDERKEKNDYGLEYSTALFMNLCLHKYERYNFRTQSVTYIFSSFLQVRPRALRPHGPDCDRGHGESGGIE